MIFNASVFLFIHTPMTVEVPLVGLQINNDSTEITDQRFNRNLSHRLQKICSIGRGGFFRSKLAVVPKPHYRAQCNSLSCFFKLPLCHREYVDSRSQFKLRLISHTGTLNSNAVILFSDNLSLVAAIIIFK